MRKIKRNYNNKDIYYFEYLAVYVDNILIVSRQPSRITEILSDMHKFKLKGTILIKHYLDCDFNYDNISLCIFLLKVHR